MNKQDLENFLQSFVDEIEIFIEVEEVGIKPTQKIRYEVDLNGAGMIILSD